MARWGTEEEIDAAIHPAAYDWLRARARAPRVDERSALALACLVYESRWTRVPAGYDLLSETAAGEPTGYRAKALLHRASETLVLVNCGTESWLRQRDGVAAIRLAMGDDGEPQLQAALDFAKNAVIDHRGAVKHVTCCGHSLGGGLAEAQVALLNAMIRGRAAPISVDGLGCGSAPFRRAIEKMAARRNWAIEPDMQVQMTHYGRGRDAVCNMRGWKDGLLGGPVACLNIYEPRQVRPQRGEGLIWNVVAEPIRNHEAGLYFALFGAAREKGFIFRYANSGFELRDLPAPSIASTGLARTYREAADNAPLIWPHLDEA